MLQVIRRIRRRLFRAPLPDPRSPQGSADRVFHRPHLARQLAAKLMSRSFASGMFLTAPRRTGKSTFVCHDLVPMLRAEHNALVLYADLLERQQEDPGEVIVGLVEDALRRHESTSTSALRGLSLSRLKAPGVELELDRSSRPRPRSLFQSLERLSDLTRRTIVLIVDEAQLTQTTQAGKDVMYMLKSARDQLNYRDRLMFRVLMTGSHREKLEQLVLSKHEAFFCAPLEELPTLGDADHLSWERAIHGPDFRPGLADLSEAFEICLRRPEVFHAVCQAAASTLTTGSGPEEAAHGPMLLAVARARIAEEHREFMSKVHVLDPLDQALLRLIAVEGKHLQPFAAQTASQLMALLSETPHASELVICPDVIRAAFARLRDAKMVWRGDGRHVLEAPQFAHWLARLEPRAHGALMVEAASSRPSGSPPMTRLHENAHA
jgi:hypothetical protein